MSEKIKKEEVEAKYVLPIQVGYEYFDLGSRVDDVALNELDSKLRKCQSNLKKIINEIEELQKDDIVQMSDNRKVKKSKKKKKN